MPVGVVKWFDPERGEGRVVPDGGGADAVVYQSAVHGALDAAGAPVQGEAGCHSVEIPEQVEREASEHCAS